MEIHYTLSEELEKKSDKEKVEILICMLEEKANAVAELATENLKLKADTIKLEALEDLLQEKQDKLKKLEKDNKELKAYKKRMEMQWLDDIHNPLEPLKLTSALQSELLKYDIRKLKAPEKISPLDYTIMAALKYCIDHKAGGRNRACK